MSMKTLTPEAQRRVLQFQQENAARKAAAAAAAAGNLTSTIATPASHSRCNRRSSYTAPSPAVSASRGRRGYEHAATPAKTKAAARFKPASSGSSSRHRKGDQAAIARAQDKELAKAQAWARKTYGHHIVGNGYSEEEEDDDVDDESVYQYNVRDTSNYATPTIRRGNDRELNTAQKSPGYVRGSRQQQREHQQHVPKPSSTAGSWGGGHWWWLLLVVVVAGLLHNIAMSENDIDIAPTTYNMYQEDRSHAHRHANSRNSEAEMTGTAGAHPDGNAPTLPCFADTVHKLDFFTNSDVTKTSSNIHAAPPAPQCTGLTTAQQTVCPPHGVCVKGYLTHCMNEIFFRLSPLGTSCVWTNRMYQFAQLWRGTLTELSTNHLSTESWQKKHQYRAVSPHFVDNDKVTGRPLFLYHTLANELMPGMGVASTERNVTQLWKALRSPPATVLPIFLTRVSPVDGAVLVGLHPSQPLPLQKPRLETKFAWVEHVWIAIPISLLVLFFYGKKRNNERG